MEDQELIHSATILAFIQFNFSKQISDCIFQDLSDHLYSKWVDSDFNLLLFMNKLDSNNKYILLKWGEQNIKY